MLCRLTSPRMQQHLPPTAWMHPAPASSCSPCSICWHVAFSSTRMPTSLSSRHMIRYERHMLSSPHTAQHCVSCMMSKGINCCLISSIHSGSVSWRCYHKHQHRHASHLRMFPATRTDILSHPSDPTARTWMLLHPPQAPCHPPLHPPLLLHRLSPILTRHHPSGMFPLQVCSPVRSPPSHTRMPCSHCSNCCWPTSRSLAHSNRQQHRQHRCNESWPSYNRYM